MKKVLFLLLFSAILSCHAAFSANPPGLMNQIEKRVLYLMDKGHVPGLSIVIVNGNSQIIKCYGYSNLSNKTLVKPQTLFELGSCSKAFTALAVMDLAEKNKLNLNDDVAKYIPWFDVRYKKHKVTVTISQLLNHTSGIPWNTISKIPEGNNLNALEITVKQLNGQNLNTLPGKKFEYATINYDVLALIIQTITAVPFEHYMTDSLFKKIGLKHTIIGKTALNSLTSTGYKIGFFSAREYDAPVFRGNNAAGYIISDANDIAEWLRLQIGLKNSLLSPAVKATHLRDESVPLHDMSSYAKGWQVKLDGSGEVYHSGVNPNFTAYITFRERSKLGVAVLANSNSGYTDYIGDEVMKLIAGEDMGKNINPNDNNDKAYSTMVMLVGIYTLSVLFFLFRIVILVLKRQRKYEAPNFTKFKIFIRAAAAIVPFVYGFYVLPVALVGFTWQSVKVWSPVSFSILVYLLAAAVAVSYLTFLLSLLFPEKDKYKKIVPQVLLFSVLSGLANVVIIVMVTAAINTGVALKYMVFYYCLVLCVYLLGRRFVQISLIKLTRGLIYDLSAKLTNRIFSTSYQKFEKIERGRVYTALNDDINTIGEASNTAILLITSVITTIGVFVYLAAIALWVTIITISMIVILSVLYSYVAKKTIKYFEAARDQRNILLGLINGMIDGFKEINLHRHKKIEFKNDLARSTKEFGQKISAAEIRFVNAFLIGESLLVLLLGFAAFGMHKMFPDIDVYTITSFVILLLYLIGPINGILTSAPAIVNIRVAWKRVVDFMNEIPEDSTENMGTVQLSSKVESFGIKGVKFSYNDQKDNVFDLGPIDLDIKAGEILFIIGGNGSGKTTLAKLMTGLYKPAEGYLSINGSPIKSFETVEYFSTVFNPMHLFKKLYAIDATLKADDIETYLNAMNLSDKVTIANNEFSTIALSTGQLKRLALLQCYLEDSPIYLFDEWAADQDPSYREFFYRIILPKMKKDGKIVIVITHDDQYFDVADKLIIIKQGQMEVDYSRLV